MEWTLLPALKGNKSYYNAKNSIILESSRKCANGLLQQLILNNNFDYIYNRSFIIMVLLFIGQR